MTASSAASPFIAGIEDPKQVGKWCTSRNSPRIDSELRLRAAHQVFQIIELPQLEHDSPLQAIAEDRHKDVMAAARSYVKGEL
ncbi:hypothetical protein OG762_21205 [Streptomyces sp. NBC_01136]|uniref:hypothetical protein n=1 Tax=unclassified Streptomyces TaxID=2593676 RepID=UPI0032542201|nr:hypothetical protein OG762_21205 [Streptomyces sp. NBC_01136]